MSDRHARRGVVALLSATLLLSAALVFLVQPMFAKFVLPRLGSTPAVWNTSLVFFQTALLAAYLYAHLSVRWLGVRRQVVVHVFVVLAALVALPIAVPVDFSPPVDANPVLPLIGLLAVTVGLPFFVVSATAPLLQRWLAASDHPAAADPYFLYRASNLGSVAGLLAYPLLVEPGVDLAGQGRGWSAGYLALVLLLAACAGWAWRSAAAATPPAQVAPTQAPPTRTRLRWVGLAFVPSSLMLGLTSFLTIDIAPIPLLWAIPLSLYLASFIVVFSPSTRATRLHRGAVFALPGAAVLLLVLLLVQAREPLWVVMPLHLAGFFVIAIACHGELARDRPPAERLTGFYLLIAAGGALGGVATGIVAPALLDSLAEYPLAIVLACLCLPPRAPRVPPGPLVRWLDFALPLAVGALVALALALISLGGSDLEGAGKTFAFGLGAGIAFNFVRRPLRFALAIGAIALAGSLAIGADEREIYRERSFFGVYRVTESADGRLHELSHGTTVHGAQALDPRRRREPLTYFHPTGPIGQLMAALPGELTERVALIGLGTGSMACYSEPGERWTFYELDPTVERIARDERLFTYLRDCRGEIDVVAGDARLSLGRAPDSSYGMLVADAFSSDAIPTHLITREALALYQRKLRPGGVLAFHISNRFLALEPVLGELARDAGLSCLAERESASARDRPRGKLPSHWVAMSRRTIDLLSLGGDPGWHACERSSGEIWTDDFSNLVGALSFP